MRKETKTKKEQKSAFSLSDKYVHILIKQLDRLEKMNTKDFIDVIYFRKSLLVIFLIMQHRTIIVYTFPKLKTIIIIFSHRAQIILIAETPPRLCLVSK